MLYQGTVAISWSSTRSTCPFQSVSAARKSPSIAAKVMSHVSQRRAFFASRPRRKRSQRATAMSKIDAMGRTIWIAARRSPSAAIPQAAQSDPLRIRLSRRRKSRKNSRIRTV